MSKEGIFHGGEIPQGMKVFTVGFGSSHNPDEGEQLDVLAPIGSSDAQVREITRPFIVADYIPGMDAVIEVYPYVGCTIWSW